MRRGILVVLAVIAGFMAISFGSTARSTFAAPGGPGCVDGGKGYVGVVPNTTEQLNWHGSYVISLCPGATAPQNGDWDQQTITYADGTFERYKIVYSTQDLTPQGVFCYWDMTIDPTLFGTGYHCPAGANQGHLYWYIVSSSGDSPYLEPAGSGGTSSRPNGIGIYR